MKVVDSVGHLLPAYQFGRFFSSPAKLEEGLMKHKKVGQSRSEYLVTVPRVWIEGDSPMPSTHQITAWEAPINILLAEVFGKARNASEAMRIDNALSTKALEVENSSVDRDARVRHACVQRRSYLHWFGKWTKPIKRRHIAEAIGH
jgi:hypothetical protein